MKFKINAHSIDVILMMLALLQFSFIPRTVFLVFRYVVTLYLLYRYRKVIVGMKIIPILLVLYAAVLCFSTLVNTFSLTWVISAFMLIMQYVTFFGVFLGMVKQHGVERLITLLCIIFLICLIVNDSLFLLIPYDFTDPNETYLIGNKFLVSYYHCLFGSLIYVKYFFSKKKYYSPLLIIYSAIVSMIVHCTTGIIIALSILMMMLFPKKIRKFMEKGSTFIGSLILENFLIWGPFHLFTNPLIVSFVVNVLHKSPNLTGRTQLYNATMDLVEKSPIYGYGHNTDIYRDTLGYGNAQNGLFHIITQAGILGTVIYFTMVYLSLNHKMLERVYGLIMYIYAMLIGSAVEINLSTQFIIAIAIIYAITNNQGCSIDGEKEDDSSL
ncbi:hypothetical protein HNQ43_001793 [Faecalicoccus acidiformans]|uniref:O-antigen ligase-related domain-containing protein n=1 Tax=Faecalicoccus acidiformans TaxID=915173 RepID=A0A7W8D208_9FIRM|nr:O-antigen ligase family protein [Faecalicoccus acidiformans]MBB5185713.1 hypothetical protein [Faecalicoccus acidiformans]